MADTPSQLQLAIWGVQGAGTGQWAASPFIYFVTVTRDQIGRARIQIVTLRTQTGISRITVTTTKIQTGIAKVVKTQIQTGVAKIVFGIDYRTTAPAFAQEFDADPRLRIVDDRAKVDISKAEKPNFQKVIPNA